MQDCPTCTEYFASGLSYCPRQQCAHMPLDNPLAWQSAHTQNFGRASHSTITRSRQHLPRWLTIILVS
ncbi:hypothetical protein RJ55_05202 [Drechmeria coniospora]|nr:hypothetical protein RJ55_05202 [Drechmeria coniospora]